MTFSRQGDVQFAREPHAHGPARLPCAERRDRGERIRLHLLAAKRAPHAETLDGDLVPRKAENALDAMAETSPRDRRSGPVRKLSDSIACSIVRMAGSGW